MNKCALSINFLWQAIDIQCTVFDLKGKEAKVK